MSRRQIFVGVSIAVALSVVAGFASAGASAPRKAATTRIPSPSLTSAQHSGDTSESYTGRYRRTSLRLPATRVVATPSLDPRRASSPTASAAPTASGFVTRNGTRLVAAGAPYRFAGSNIYNANSIDNCWYTLGSGSGLDSSLTAIGSGQKVFRSWFFQSLATTNGSRNWSAFDHTLAVAKAHGQRIIATLGNQWGDCEDGAYKTESWYQSGYSIQVPAELSKTYRDWVAEAVARYKDTPTIMAWQLMNEAEDATSRGGTCSASASATLKGFTQNMAKLVKEIDSNHLLSLGTMGSGQCGTSGVAYRDLHAVPGIDLCEYHDYGAPDAALPGDLQADLGYCNALNKPLFVGETGIELKTVGNSVSTRASDFAAKFIAQFRAGVVGELVWNWRDAAHGGSSTADYDFGPNDPILGTFNAY